MENRIIHISFAKMDFKCPHCKKQYDDQDEIYYNKAVKNKSSCTSIKCDCGEKFGFTYDMTGQAVGFKLKQ